MTTPYNPDFHSSIVLNQKEIWKRHTNQELKLTDEQIYYCFEEAYSFMDGSESKEVSERNFFECMQDKQ